MLVALNVDEVSGDDSLVVGIKGLENVSMPLLDIFNFWKISLRNKSETRARIKRCLLLLHHYGNKCPLMSNSGGSAK